MIFLYSVKYLFRYILYSIMVLQFDFSLSEAFKEIGLNRNYYICMKSEY